MKPVRKIYVNPGELIEVRFVHEDYAKTAKDWAEQVYPQKTLLKLHSVSEISDAIGSLRVVPWDRNHTSEENNND